ncbi:MAG: bifunctional glutamate N-acetyltransferase/amino-acid acetyltransferase ArgJ [Acidobacteriota bacterium]|nr:bifunctional glutamate N-acetyltransferase/amino-acid acetyltransferase ArgJ [Acidobacteriota bacterium]
MRIALIPGAVTAPAGFTAAGIAAGIKKNGNPDVAIIAADATCAAAGVFTINKAQAAPILISKGHLEQSGGRAQAIIVNAGCANACTGEQGAADAREMALLTSSLLGCEAEEVLVASTGVIGVNLPMDKVRRGIEQAHAARASDAGEAASLAIMTTDPFPKARAVECTLEDGRTFRVGGIAKGSGMIEPRMATMLAFLTTDVEIEPELLQRAVAKTVDLTFNAITVDGECSTNDCVFALASAASGVAIREADFETFVVALIEVAGFMAREIVRGGEGATKLVAINVSGARTDADAWMAARTIANSPLVKTAIHGSDPNWGRLVAAAGRSGAAFELEKTSVSIGTVHLFVKGTPHDERADEAAVVLGHTDREIEIYVDLGFGTSHRATVWTCDFSAEYVRINAEYRT